MKLPDPDDRHVLTATIRAKAQVVVTFNLKDFPTEALAPWDVEAVHPDAFGNLSACERALHEAENVTDLNGPFHNGGWLRFDGSRLAEERGARYLRLGRLDLADFSEDKPFRDGDALERHGSWPPACSRGARRGPRMSGEAWQLAKGSARQGR
ncbi:hypothetical protein ACFY1U_16365 [Streptomyces sp. NPDC001351]|uniref:hypothetical protein n=1 Tax=Streptomyces sp. NPDC001351 TaxID=3364564 RepID=UPI0036801404